MKNIAQCIIALAILAKGHDAILFGFHTHLQGLILTGFGKVFDNYRMGRRFKGKLHASLLLSIHKNLIIRYTFYLQLCLGISFIL